MNERKTVAGIDHGKPPAAFLRQQQEVNNLAETSVTDTFHQRHGPAATNGNGHASKGLDTDYVRTNPSARKPIKVERIALELVSDSVPFKLEFDVGEVCVQEHFISLLLVNDITFRPSKAMRLTLKHAGNSYPVHFAGAEFEFKTVNVRGISFIREPNKNV